MHPPRMASQLSDGRDIFYLLGVGIQGETLGDSPDKSLPIVGARRNNMVVEGVPIGVEDGSGVTAEKGDLVGEFTALVERDDRKGAPAAGFPIDREVFGVGLMSARDDGSASRQIIQCSGLPPNPRSCISSSSLFPPSSP